MRQIPPTHIGSQLQRRGNPSCSLFNAIQGGIPGILLSRIMIVSGYRTQQACNIEKEQGQEGRRSNFNVHVSIKLTKRRK